jgi:hypothetical protein
MTEWAIWARPRAKVEPITRAQVVQFRARRFVCRLLGHDWGPNPKKEGLHRWCRRCHWMDEMVDYA